MSIEKILAEEIKAEHQQVASAITLLDQGATVPFIARYRKEATGGLDDTQLRLLEERLIYNRDLNERKQQVLKTIESQGKLTEPLKAQIEETRNKQSLEDLYLPYRPKRKSKSKSAIEAGLEPLAQQLIQDPSQSPEVLAENFLNPEKKITDVKSALEGARNILIDSFSEQAELVSQLRDHIRSEGVIISTVKKNKEKEGAKFQDYFEFQEKVNKIPSHRALAIFRGRRSNILDVTIDIPTEETEAHPCLQRIQAFNEWSDQGRAADPWLTDVFKWTWKVKLQTQLQNELLSEIKQAADKDSIHVFAQNLNHLLMAAPAGDRNTMGLDPGLRSGVKAAVVDATGKLIDHTTIFPHAPKNDWDQAIETLQKFSVTHKVQLISIGNGTASRETEDLVKALKTKYPDAQYQSIVVSEAGASVYSASAYAAKEFPDLDVTFRGAVSIARRLQDPLAELVKIDPKSIGVGQYQHDVNQAHLARSLDAVVEDCVNAVGVDVNMASSALLARISGLNSTIAGNLVSFRDKNGPFKSRESLKQVPRFGNKTFEQAAGFLRLKSGEHPLDQSGVHPEAYPIVESIADKHQRKLSSLIGDSNFLSQLKPEDFTTEQFGIPTVKDILLELDKPGRDPRPEFKTVQFKAGINKIADLKPQMVLEGVVSNVTNFGAFINIGVHQDGLVHVSALSTSFVKDPHKIVKAGDIVKVKVLDVDNEKKRISLTMRLDDKGQSSDKNRSNKQSQTDDQRSSKPRRTFSEDSKKANKSNNRPSQKPREKAKKPAALPPGKTGTFADLFSALNSSSEK